MENKFLATSFSLPEIKATPEFASLLAAGLVYAATPRQEKAFTVMFIKNGIRYAVYANGYVRRGKFDDYMNKYQLNPIDYKNYNRPERIATLDAYRAKLTALLNYLTRNNL